METPAWMGLQVARSTLRLCGVGVCEMDGVCGSAESADPSAPPLAWCLSQCCHLWATGRAVSQKAMTTKGVEDLSVAG